MKRNKTHKLNQVGFGHHIILPVLVIVAVAAIGVRVLTASHAASAPQMVFYNNAKIYTSTSTGPAQAVTSTGAGTGSAALDATYALNGTKIFYIGSSNGLYSVDPNGQNAKLVATLPGSSNTYYQTLVWSEAAQRFYSWSSTTNSGTDPYKTQMITFDVNGLNIKTLYSPTDFVQPFFGPWSPDGTKILTQTYNSVTKQYFAGYFNVSSGTRTAISNNPCYEMSLYEVSWTPDSQHLVCNDSSTRQIDEVNLAAHTYRVLATNPLLTTAIYGMSLSPDGNSLAYDTQNGTTAHGVCRVYIDNLATNKTQLVASHNASDCSYLDWGPGSGNLAFDVNSNASVNLPPAQVDTVSNTGLGLHAVFTGSGGVAANSQSYQAVFGINWSTQ